MDPLSLLSRLTAPVPAPRLSPFGDHEARHTVRYAGVLASASKLPEAAGCSKTDGGRAQESAPIDGGWCALLLGFGPRDNVQYRVQRHRSHILRRGRRPVGHGAVSRHYRREDFLLESYGKARSEELVAQSILRDGRCERTPKVRALDCVLRDDALALRVDGLVRHAVPLDAQEEVVGNDSPGLKCEKRRDEKIPFASLPESRAEPSSTRASSAPSSAAASSSRGRRPCGRACRCSCRRGPGWLAFGRRSCRTGRGD